MYWYFQKSKLVYSAQIEMLCSSSDRSSDLKTFNILWRTYKLFYSEKLKMKEEMKKWL